MPQVNPSVHMFFKQLNQFIDMSKVENKLFLKDFHNFKDLPVLKRTSLQGFPVKSENHCAASAPSSHADPFHSHTPISSVTSYSFFKETLRGSIPGAFNTVTRR